MDRLFQIGAVARMFHLSVGSLRHYEALGLLRPERIDPATGYRYYGPGQFETLNTIRYLRALVDVALTALRAVVPGVYPEKVGLLLIGCCVLALGAWLEVVADVVMLPGDAFARVLARVTGIEFGKVRVVSDVTMSAIAAAMCLAALHALVGVREGTLISALLVGNIIRAYARLLGPLARRLVGERSGK